MKRKMFALTLVFLLAFMLLSGCAAQSQGASVDSSMPSDSSSETGSSMETAPSAPSENTVGMDTVADVSESAPAPDAEEMVQERKIIQNADFSLETLDYDQTLESIETLVENCGGYVESSQTTGNGATGDYYRARWASFTVRISAEGLQDFARILEECGSVTNSNYYTNEVTDYYYDTEAHLNSLQLQEERLLDILSKAEQLSEVIELENTLANVRYQIESLQGTLRRLDSQVAMSTVNISVQEVYEYSPDQGIPKSLGERISSEFAASLVSIRRTAENLIVFLVGNIIGIAIFAAVVVGVVVAVRRIRRKKRPAATPNQNEDTQDTDKKE